jgi:hypothetical protein
MQATGESSHISNNLRYGYFHGDYKNSVSSGNHHNIVNPYSPNTPNNPNHEQNSNSFRHTGIIGAKKYKTTKCSRKFNF